MTADQVLQILQDAVARVMEVPATSVARETRLHEDLQADSLAIVEIVEIVEEQVLAGTSRPLRLDDAMLDGLVTVGDAVDLVVAGL